MKKITKATTTWHRYDAYTSIIKCENRFKTAWRALTRGEVVITWQKKASVKDKRLHLKGKL